MSALPSLSRPDSIDEEQWAVIERHYNRMSTALTMHDHELAIGCAKDMVESVAKVVLDARGETFGNKTDYPALVNRAHSALERQPGQGLATDPPIREIAQGVKNAALAICTLRNSHGTGHGRVTPAVVEAEHGEMAAQAAVLWSGWVLRRLDHMVQGRAGDIVRDLRGGASFYKGQLRRRIEAASLPAMEPQNAERLGLAVGQRAARGTGTVLVDGLASDLAREAPTQYRAGAIEGAFVDQEGYVRSTERSARAALDLLETMDEDDAVRLVRRVTKTVVNAECSYAFTVAEREAVAHVLRSHQATSAGRPGHLLVHISDQIAPLPTDETEPSF